MQETNTSYLIYFWFIKFMILIIELILFILRK